MSDAKKVTSQQAARLAELCTAPRWGLPRPPTPRPRWTRRLNRWAISARTSLTNSNSPKSDSIPAWGGDKVLYYQTAKDDTFGFMLIEAMNEDVLKTVYGDKNVTGTLADGLTVKATAVEAADSVWVVETILRGGAVKRVRDPLRPHHRDRGYRLQG